MRRFGWMEIASCLFLSLVFGYAGFDKLFHYSGFIRALQSYVIVPDGLAPYVALSLILGEIGVAVGLIVPAWRRVAAFSAAGLLSIFTIALSFNYWMNPEAICGCWFTVTLNQGAGHHVLQNLLMTGVAVSVAVPRLHTSAVAAPDPAYQPPTDEIVV